MNRFTPRSRPARGPPTRPSWVPFASLSPSSPSACGLAAPSGAEVYRWTDPEGKVHYTSDLSRVPASQQEAAKASAGEPKGGAVMRIESRPPAKPTGPAAAPEGAPAGPDGTPAAPPQPAEEVYGGRNESWWRSEAAKFREAIERLEDADRAVHGGRVPLVGRRGRPRLPRRVRRGRDACGRHPERAPDEPPLAGDAPRRTRTAPASRPAGCATRAHLTNPDRARRADSAGWRATEP